MAPFGWFVVASGYHAAAAILPAWR